MLSALLLAAQSSDAEVWGSVVIGLAGFALLGFIFWVAMRD